MLAPAIPPPLEWPRFPSNQVPPTGSQTGKGENMRRLFAFKAMVVLFAVIVFPALLMGQVIPNASAPAVPANQTSKMKFTQDGAFANVSFSQSTSGFTTITFQVATG